uniref:Uncharacterized protein n=1 Tax=Caenorhabditis japonica TaxID=281687 RepID=A0A8R1I552_CAEJA
MKSAEAQRNWPPLAFAGHKILKKKDSYFCPSFVIIQMSNAFHSSRGSLQRMPILLLVLSWTAHSIKDKIYSFSGRRERHEENDGRRWSFRLNYELEEEEEDDDEEEEEEEERK